jgi:hypothetical protein
MTFGEMFWFSQWLNFQIIFWVLDTYTFGLWGLVEEQLVKIEIEKITKGE